MKQESLFPKTEQTALKFAKAPKGDTTVTCLGQTFTDDAARRAHFTELLRAKLQDPEFRKIEGFPIATDEAILALSDPPYYTACPNPWLGDFVQEWEAAKPVKPAGWHYHREPFAADVSEGKNDPIYNAHSYHTKVPHKAIMRYILHYTEPGDIVFDGFCGTGMTGVAAQMCGDRKTVESLGYMVKPDGTILQPDVDAEGKPTMVPFSKLGARRAVLNDLSPAATFIAYNYNTPVDVAEFEREAKRILSEVEKECGWMYQTKHTDGKMGTINFVVWSDVYHCPNAQCQKEIVFWDVAFDRDQKTIRDEFSCPFCSSKLTKKQLDHAWNSKFDKDLSQTIRQTKQKPVLINYSTHGKRFEKKPDNLDLELFDKLDSTDNIAWYPTDRMMEGKETRRNDPVGISHVHHFFFKSGLNCLALYWDKARNSIYRGPLMLSHTAALPYVSKMRRFRPDGKGGGPLSGTLYVASLITPPNPLKTIERNSSAIYDALASRNSNRGYVANSCQSSDYIGIPSNSLEYIFIDPPFGSNLNYSELNFLWESWLQVVTNNKQEAIENSVQNKGANEYRQLMSACFREAYRMLKPGRWMTVEFSNTQAAVWNSIQTAMSDAGFIVANVSALDKKQGSFKAVTTPTAVKQDLVISAYKPNGGFEARFETESATEEGVWDFVRTHLQYLPVVKRTDGRLVMIAERDPRILYDRLIAYYVRHNVNVPISSPEFQQGLRDKFIEIDGMFFLAEQASEYKRAMAASGPRLETEMFVQDERSAIDWLYNYLRSRPSPYNEIQPEFMKQITAGWRKSEAKPELRDLLEANFIQYDGQGQVPSQIHTYLSTNFKDMRGLEKEDPALVHKAKDRWYVPDPKKSEDLEKQRKKSLLREWADLLETCSKAKKRIGEVRMEVVRAGFADCWERKDYATLVTVADKIPESLVLEDEQLLMYYEIARERV